MVFNEKAFIASTDQPNKEVDHKNHANTGIDKEEQAVGFAI